MLSEREQCELDEIEFHLSATYPGLASRLARHRGPARITSAPWLLHAGVVALIVAALVGQALIASAAMGLIVFALFRLPITVAPLERSWADD